MYGPRMMEWDFFWHAGPFGMVFMLLFWFAVIYVIVSIFRAIFGRKKEERETPMDILKRRYAAGEITKAEFDQMKRDILG